MFRVSLTFLVCILVHAVSSGQAFTTRKTTTEKARQYYDAGRSDGRMEDWSQALRNYRKALVEDPKFIDASIQIALVQFEQGHTEEARAGLLKVVEIAPDYNYLIWYQLGVMEWRLDRFEAATGYFEKYIALEKDNPDRIAQAKKYLVDSRFASEAVKNPVPFNPQRLSDSVNSIHSEYLPTLTADGETLIFTRNAHNDENFYISRMKNGVWSLAYPMNSINSEWNEGAQTISADGRFFIFTGCNRRDGWGSCDLYFTRQTASGEWTPPVNLGPPVNTRGWESQPSLSADGKTLYFVAERAGGIGGRDIWISRRTEDGRWSTPENAGPGINSPDHEQSPFIHHDGKTLYFMSKGYPSLGGYDLYFSKKQPDGTWGTPKNLGYPINTKAHEGSLFVSLDGKSAFFSSDKSDFGGVAARTENDNIFEKQGSTKTSDIFTFELHPAARPDPVTYVKATVYDAAIRVPLAAEIEFTDLETGAVLVKDISNDAGSFIVCLPIGKDYALNVSKEGYLFHSENFALKEVAHWDKPFLLEIFLEKIGMHASPEANISKPVILKNVFFETASAALRPESKAELNRLRKMLTDHPAMKIQINGHTDNVGTEPDNLQLSLQRAKAVYEFLLSNGIAADRLQYKGFGESQPIDSNETAEGRQNNRRTEFVVIY